MKLWLCLQGLTTLKIEEQLLTANSPNLSDLTISKVSLTANSPKFGFRYNLDS